MFEIELGTMISQENDNQDIQIEAILFEIELGKMISQENEKLFCSK